MEIAEVQKSYARWSLFYDQTFGAVTQVGRRATVDYICSRGGKVLELGVGTGLALPFYKPDVEVTGIDYSEEMLAKARARVARRRLAHVRELRRMDARQLDLPDASFDTVAAMHVLSVAPEPERVMAEIARVLKPGGQAVVTNHFAREKGVLAAIERFSAPFSNLLGWHSDFQKSVVLGEAALAPVGERSLPPLGMMTMLVLQKAA